MRSESVIIKDLATNTLNPEIIEMNPPAENSITVLTDSFFTNLVCQESLDGLYKTDGMIPDMSKFEAYIGQLDWWRRCEYKYMKTRARMLIWAEGAFFRQIATCSETEKLT